MLKDDSINGKNVTKFTSKHYWCRSTIFQSFSVFGIQIKVIASESNPTYNLGSVVNKKIFRRDIQLFENYS